jgi:hypothetical protein
MKFPRQTGLPGGLSCLLSAVDLSQPFSPWVSCTALGAGGGGVRVRRPNPYQIQRKTWCVGPYAGVDYNLTLCPLQSRLQHLILRQSRLYPPFRDFGIGLRHWWQYIPEVHGSKAEKGDDAGREKRMEDLVVDGCRYEGWVILHSFCIFRTIIIIVLNSVFGWMSKQVHP